MFAVENWRGVQVAGSTIGTPALEAVYSTTQADFSTTFPVQFLKDPFGTVHVRGSFKWTGVAATMGATQNILTFPAAYWPNTFLRFYATHVGAGVPPTVSKVVLSDVGVLSFDGYGLQATAETRTNLAFTYMAGDR